LIRPFRFQDASLLSALQAKGTYLDLRRAVLWPHDLLSEAMKVYWPFSRQSIHTLVMREMFNGTNLSGFVQYLESRGAPEADIVFCAPAIDATDRARSIQFIWQKLLGQLVMRVGDRGCQRVYARVVDGAPELEVFWQLGFSAYARERVYVHNSPAVPVNPSRARLWKPQRTRDIWGVGQLYASVTPKLVQQAENLPRSDYLAPYRDGFGRGVDRRYVWANHDEPSASLRLIRGRAGCWLKLITHPRVFERVDELLQDAVRLVPADVQRLYISVREYQSELEGAILRAGFTWMATEMLMVKHTTVLAKKPVLKQIPVMEGIEVRPTATSTRMTKLQSLAAALPYNNHA
jgi:hypothetical protein